MIVNKLSLIPNIFLFIILFINIISVSILTIFINIPSSVIQLILYGSYLVLLFVYIKKQDVKINIWMLVLVLFACISLITNDYDSKFNAPLRLFLWILVISLLGPLLFSSALINFRTKLLKAFLTTFYITGAISTLFWVFGLPVLGKGVFTGLFIQSMILAPISAIGALYAFHNFIKEKEVPLKTLYLVIFILNTMSLMLAASRGAIAAFLVGFTILIVFSKFKFKKLGLTFLSVFMFLYFSFNNSTIFFSKDSLILSNLYNKGIENSRDLLWDARINEFKSSPIFGIGFATQTSNYQFQEIDEKGRIEPGSTYLMILAMTGIFGFISFLTLTLRPLLSRSFIYRITRIDTYLSAILGFFLVHFAIEGYIFSAGSFMGLIFWLVLGVTYPYSKNQLQKESI